jgi:dTDP-glucose 4,6-dehydratase
VPFEQGLAQTVQWYVDNKPWWQAVRSGDYRKYYQRQYGTREDAGS